MTWIQHNKPIVITVIIGLLLIFGALCFALFATVNKPAPIITETSVATLTEEQYVDKYNQWNIQGYAIMNTIVAILNGSNVSKEQAANIGAQLSFLKADVDNTIPPPKYVEVHAHYQQAIQDIYDATLALGHSKTKEATAKFSHASAELDVVKAMMQSM